MKASAVVRTRPWYGGFLTLLLLPPALALIPYLVGLGVLGVLGFFALLFIALGVVMTLEQRLWRSALRRVTADATGLTFDGLLVVAKASISSVRLVERGGKTVLRVDRYKRPVEVEVDSETEGRAMIAALGLDARQSLGSFWFNAGSRRRTRARIFAPLVVLASFFTVAFHASELLEIRAGFGIHLFPVVLLALAVVGYLTLGPVVTRIKVGSDGLRIRHDFRRERFVPYSELATIEPKDGEVTLRLRDGESLLLTLGGSGLGRYLESLGPDNWGEGLEVVDAFVHRIRESMSLHRAGSGDASSLARAGRQSKEWVADLLALTERGPSYRAAVPTIDALWQIVEDRTRAAADRIPAAIALRPSLDDAGRKRLHQNAESSADPQVRAAFYAAAGANEEKLEDTLDEIDDTEGVQARR